MDDTTLTRALATLPDWLDSLDGWQSLDIDYHPPRVERLFRPFEDGRIALHRVHPCEPADALFHPHPWPCAIQVLRGTYEMALGAGPAEAAPPRSAWLRAEAPFRYAMAHPDGWHAVRIVGAPALTVMVTGHPWDRRGPRPTTALAPLAPPLAGRLLADVRDALTRPARAVR